ncbi:unnamed protein product, partial [Timema podura]|nr:unnamed protein product [Timema podura]
MNLACVCRQIYQSINTKIEELYLVDGISKKISTPQNVVHHVTVQSLASTGLNIDQDLRNKIKLYRSIHDTLCDVCELVNEIFSIQCLLISAALFSDVTFCFYRSFQEIFAYYHGQTVNLFFLISFTCWPIISSLVWVIMVIVVSRTSEEANRTGSLIHAMRCPIQDSVMDYEFVGGVTTYLVISIQFHIMGNGISKKISRSQNVVHHVTVQSLTSPALNIDQDLRKKIKLYRSIHDTICDVCEMVNEIFSIQCLLISAALFSDVTFCFYRVFQEIFAYYHGQTVNLLFLIYFTCWPIIFLLSWVVMVIVVSRTSEEANRTGSLIHAMRCPIQDSVMDYE